MPYRVIVPPHVERDLTHYPPQLKTKIRAALDQLSIDPYQGKALKEELVGRYSFRVARYRIIDRIHDGVLEVLVVAIGHRRTIYRAIG